MIIYDDIDDGNRVNGAAAAVAAAVCSSFDIDGVARRFNDDIGSNGINGTDDNDVAAADGGALIICTTQRTYVMSHIDNEWCRGQSGAE